MAGTRSARHPKAVEPKEESNPQVEPEPTKAVSKAEAVRQALANGLDGLDDIAGFIRSKHGIEMPRPQLSAYRSQQKARERSGSTATKRGRKQKTAVEGYLAPPKIVPTGDGDLLDAMEAMKPLVARLGVDKVKRLVDLLG